MADVNLDGAAEGLLRITKGGPQAGTCGTPSRFRVPSSAASQCCWHIGPSPKAPSRSRGGTCASESRTCCTCGGRSRRAGRSQGRRVAKLATRGGVAGGEEAMPVRRERGAADGFLSGCAGSSEVAQAHTDFVFECSPRTERREPGAERRAKKKEWLPRVGGPAGAAAAAGPQSAPRDAALGRDGPPHPPQRRGSARLRLRYS